jgi:hypothetical protein
MREFAIHTLSALAGGMIAVVFARFIVNTYHFLKERDWDL